MPLNLLIIDDSAIVRKVLIKSLRLTDFTFDQIFQATNGAEALACLERSEVQLVFLDINMPTMNGMEFMRVLRGQPHTMHIPVIVVSTEGSKDRRQELFSLGVKAFLRKPVTPEELNSTVAKVIEDLSHDHSEASI